MLKLNTFLRVAILGIVIRLIAGFFTHPWDIQTFYNFFIDLSKGVAPYTTMEYLSNFARAHSTAGWDYNFEYYAYPPLPILLYFLPAKLFALVHPGLDYNFVISHAAPVLKVPLDFNLFFKIPLFITDLLIAYLLSKRVDLRTATKFFLNPYVILISASWMFDSVMTLFLLLALLSLEKKKFNDGGIYLGLGAMTKLVPLFIFPAVVLRLIKDKISLKRLASFVTLFLLTNILIIAPFYEGVRFILEFHSSRVGGGLTPHLLAQQLPYYLNNNYINFDTLLPIYHFVIPNVALLIFVIGMFFIYYLVAKKELSMNQTILITLLGYLIFNKIINEQYIFIALPFLLIDLHESPSDFKNMLYNMLWVLPFCFAIVNVPIIGFSFPLLNSLDVNIEKLKLYADWITGSGVRLMFLRGTALLFSASAILYTWYALKGAKDETT